MSLNTKNYGRLKKSLTLVTNDCKPTILHRQILATHSSDVVGINFLKLFDPAKGYPVDDHLIHPQHEGRRNDKLTPAVIDFIHRLGDSVSGGEGTIKIFLDSGGEAGLV